MTGWRGPLQSPSGVPPFTLEPGRQTHSGIGDALGSGSRDQGICGGFGFSLASFAERSLGSHSLDRVESQGTRHPFFSFWGHRCGLVFSRTSCFLTSKVESQWSRAVTVDQKLPPHQTGSATSQFSSEHSAP